MAEIVSGILTGVLVAVRFGEMDRTDSIGNSPYLEFCVK